MSNAMHKNFRFSIDRGGTFTDVYAEVPGETGFRVVKLLSEDPENYPDAPREGIRRILEETTGKPVSAEKFDADVIEWIRMGTTVATNALLERKGVPTALVITEGFGDLLKIGNQSRPRIFDLEIEKPELLYRSVIEVEERVRFCQKGETLDENSLVQGTTGEKMVVLKKPDLGKVREQLQTVFDAGIRSVAVVFIHSYTFHEHELLIKKLAQSIGFTQISLSHEVMARVKMVARGDTTLVDAYLTPHIQQYLSSFRSGFSDQLQNTPLLFMQSDGGLVGANGFKGSNAILSGPAGGVVGYASTTDYENTGQPIIGFDMGGTSTDVSRFGKDYELIHETETAGVRIQAPQMQIKTVAAGGGSRLFFRNGMFEVGPESAGAHPGPVCYRKKGHLAITDANLILGRLHVDYFPKIFGKTEDQPLDREASQQAFDQLTAEINDHYRKQGRPALSTEEVALGFLKVANEVMVRPIREISVMRGYDIKDHILACFGGAGGQHACAIARDLGISKIFIHRFAGILSAYGMGLADVVVEKQEPSATAYDAQSFEQGDRLRLEQLVQEATKELKAQGYQDEQITVQRYLNLRYDGTDTAIMVLEPKDLNYEKGFRSTYQREFGFDLQDKALIIDDIRVRAIATPPTLQNFAHHAQVENPEPELVTPCFFDEGWMDTPLYEVDKIRVGSQIEGPAILIQDTSTIMVEPHCVAQITEAGDIAIEVLAQANKRLETQVDPIQLSIFSNLFMSIAEQMGRTLEKTAISTNIKERLDFSCAIFSKTGGLVANAPHQPVHLGAMGEAVRQQIQIQGENLKEGDILVTNHPIAGGSHLPDITVITPVWEAGEIIFFVASRGHHADIGGISPGSMPPFSHTLDEEGACIKSFKLVEAGQFQEQALIEILEGTRRLSDNLSDLKAQVAANRKGADLLEEMVAHYSLQVVHAYMEHIQDSAEMAVREMLTDLSQSQGLEEVDTIYAEDHLDDGSPIVLRLTIDRRDGSATFDFTGTGPELWGNLNAPRAVTHSAILYSLRCLIKNDIPLNQGCLKPIQIVIEAGSLLAPSEEAAVVGGNVLTSQRITDVILKALNAAAASQGCMNNLTFGNENFGYYETIGGGAGAGATWQGQSGVHTHMTNTRITDPEILERRYPVLLREFSIRSDSGGEGEHNGGDGLIRDIEFLDLLNVAILSERRTFAPYGLAGGKPGKTGKNQIIRANGKIQNLGGKNEFPAQFGDRIRIETPGGGGYGE